MLEQQLGVDVQSRLIWHGGEPLALPITYLDRAMALQHEMLQDLNHRILVQSNLYRLTDEMLYLLKRHDVGLGVSMDVIGGVRRDVRRNETEDAVVANLDLLERRGVGYGAITVLAKHNHRQLKAVHDFWANRRIDFRILPLLKGRIADPKDYSRSQMMTSLSRCATYSIIGSKMAPSLMCFRFRNGFKMYSGKSLSRDVRSTIEEAEVRASCSLKRAAISIRRMSAAIPHFVWETL